jgi:hypothetical protein
MIWIFLLLSAIGTSLFQFGAVSLLSATLAIALKIALLVIAVLVGMLLWKHFKNK